MLTAPQTSPAPGVPAAPSAPWLDTNRTDAERVEALLGALTLAEKISLLDDTAPAVTRLGLARFRYGGEVLHGLCNSGRATVFPMPISLAATFNPSLIEAVATATADEMRAKWHDADWRRCPRLSLWVLSPVINILRDPRWGRAQETYGEDPWLSGELGSAFVRGLQGDDPHRLKLAACAKHLGVHSGPEALRQKFNAEVSPKDLYETYLVAFEALVRAGAASVMATYNRVNGEHCCAHSEMIGAFLRDGLGFDGVVLSDGGALGSLHRGHALTADAVETAGLCLREQLDFELGHEALHRAAEAIERGLVDAGAIDRAVRRILTLHCRTRVFDPEGSHPYSRIPRSVIQCERHRALALQAARESVVLLKNDSAALPLRAERDGVVLVTGPQSVDLQGLMGNFYKGVSGTLVSLLEGITAQAPEGVTVTHSQGCLLTHPNLYDSDWAMGLSEWADTVVVCLGFSPLMEGEQGECIAAPDGGDKRTVALPENQLDHLRAMRQKLAANARGQRLVVVVTGGGPMELAPLHELADALLWVGYGGEQAGTALGEVLWGSVNPSGKLPFTIPQKLDDLPPYESYAMAGRTYRFAQAKPLYPFGFGLSYTPFALGQPVHTQTADTLHINVPVSNVGDRDGAVVVQLYASWPDRVAFPLAPHCELKACARCELTAGADGVAALATTLEQLRPFDANGRRVRGPVEVDIHVTLQAPVASLAGAQDFTAAQRVVLP